MTGDRCMFMVGAKDTVTVVWGGWKDWKLLPRNDLERVRTIHACQLYGLPLRDRPRMLAALKIDERPGTKKEF